MASKESNDTNLKTLSMDDERQVIISDGTKKVVRLLVAANELYGEIYQIVENQWGETLADQHFNQEFSESLSNLMSRLTEYLGMYAYESVMMKDNVTKDYIRI